MLMLFAALALIPFITLPPYVRAKRSERWPTSDGVISANWLKVIHNPRDGMNYYHGEIEYRYRAEGRDYVSSRIAFGTDDYSSQSAAQQRLDRYPMRSPVKVYCDPADPSFAVLKPGRNDEMELLYMMQLCFIAAFGSLFIGTWLWYQDQKESAGVARPPAIPGNPATAPHIRSSN